MMSISSRRRRVRIRSSSSASVTPSGNASFRSSNVRYPCSFASLISSRMRAWTSTDEYNPGTPSAGTESAPLLLGLTDRDLTRLPLSAMSRGFLLRFPRPFRCDFVALRIRLLLTGRADDRRLPPLRFECLAKFVRLRIWTKACGLPRGGSRLSVGPAGGLGKLVELFLQVKNLFLQIYDLTSAQPGNFDPVFCRLQTTTHNTLAGPLPPLLDHCFCGRRHLLH